MTSKLFQFSGVVVGSTHNPTILNPDFLSAEGIVPKSWDWDVADTITTPPLAMVRYENGVTIMVDQGKLQVTDPDVERGPGKSKVSEIASAYVKTLRHVRYTAVGNNFQSLIPMASPDDFLKHLFLKEGPWNAPARNLDAVGIRLIYPLPSGKLTVAIDSGEAKLPHEAENNRVVLFNANFSRDCSEHPAFEEVLKYVQKAMDDWVSYQDLLAGIVKDANVTNS